MQEHNKENSDIKNKNYTNQGEICNSEQCFYEKMIIIYLVIVALLLFYFSLFFIHNINFRGYNKDKQSTEIEHPKDDKDDDDKSNNNTIEDNITNNIEGSNKIDDIFNNVTNGIKNDNTINSIISGNDTNNTSSGNGQISNPSGEPNNSGDGTNNPGGGTSNPNGGSNNPGGETSNPNEGSDNPGGTGNSGGDINNPEETSKPGESTTIPDEEIVNNKDRFKVAQESKDWEDIKSLNIFNNYYFNGNSIIAPNIRGKYNFTVENYKDTKILYNIKFMEENVYNINMVYKLKKNGLYIAGDEQTYVKYTDLNTEDILIDEHKKDIFTLEWKWQDSDNDTQIGETQGANYKMNIKVNASEQNN